MEKSFTPYMMVLGLLGYPATLSRRVHYGVLKAKRPHIQNTIWLRSVIKWQTWLNYEENHICYLHPGHNGDYDLLHRHIPQLDGLVSNTVIKIIGATFPVSGAKFV